MTTLSLNDTFTKNGKITIKFDGHAGSGEYGHDLACAASSILCLQTVILADELYERGWLDDKPVRRVKSGHSTVIIQPRNDMYGIIRRMLEVVEMGCVALCVYDSEHIKLTHRLSEAKFPSDLMESFTNEQNIES